MVSGENEEVLIFLQAQHLRNRVVLVGEAKQVASGGLLGQRDAAAGQAGESAGLHGPAAQVVEGPGAGERVGVGGLQGQLVGGGVGEGAEAG